MEMDGDKKVPKGEFQQLGETSPLSQWMQSFILLSCLPDISLWSSLFGLGPAEAVQHELQILLRTAGNFRVKATRGGHPALS